MEVFILTKKKNSNLKIAAMWGSLFLAIVCLLLAFVIRPLLVVAIAFALIWLYIYMNKEIEYECSYFDGDFRFAKVINKSRRKHLGIYTAEDVIVIAPAGDDKVAHYEKDTETVVKDYTSGEEGTPYYDIVVRDSKTNKALLIKAELNDKYLNSVCIKYRSKVVLRQW